MEHDPPKGECAPWAVYELPPRGESVPGLATPCVPDSYLLQRYAVWFCRLRWAVVAILAATGAAAVLRLPLDLVGLALSAEWPLLTASFLFVANLAYLWRMPVGESPESLRWLWGHVWLQIVVDLIVLTVVVHFLGSVETPAVFMYLFHIILACIIVPRWQSLLVTVLSAGLYLACLALESLVLTHPTTALLPISHPLPTARASGLWVTHVGFTFVIWVAIWHLASQVADALRKRDQHLADANLRLRASIEERGRHMLQTTHELKAPFAAIHANAQLLLRGTCGTLPQPAREVVERIVARCAAVSLQVIDMLQLANLRSESQTRVPFLELDLPAVIQASIARFEPAAAQRDVRIQVELEPCAVRLAEDHLKMLLDNLISNAVNYSFAGGTVYVDCSEQSREIVEVSIRDEGIGIVAEKLPRIFEDYYRTNEASRHNKESTGLGLAIVRDVAHLAGIQVRVESAPGRGTRFTLRIPRDPDPERS